MAELDSLNIRITASTKKATDAIDGLKGALSGLGSSISPAARELNALADSLERIASVNLKGISSALGSLNRASDKIAKVVSPNVDTTGITKANSALDRFGDKMEGIKKISYDFAKALSVEYGFEGNDKQIRAIRDGIIQMFSVYDKSDKFEEAKENLEDMLRSFGDFEKHDNSEILSGAVENAQRFRDLIRDTMIYLPKGWESKLSGTVNGQLKSAEQLRGILGIRNTTTDRSKGLNGEELIRRMQENNVALPHGITADDTDDIKILDAIIKELNKDVELTRVKMENVNGVMMTNAEVTQKVMGSVSSLASDIGSIGAEAEKEASAIETVGNAATNAAMPLDIFADALQKIGNVTMSDSLKNLWYLKEALSKIGGESGLNAANSLPQIAEGIRAFSGITIPDFGEKLPNLAIGLRSLGSGNVVNAAQALPHVAQGLRELNGITISADVERIAELAHALSRFGLANIEKAVVNIPPLAQALSGLMATLSNAPAVNENTVRLVYALSELNVNSLNSANGVNRLSGGLRKYIPHAQKAHKTTKSLASVFGSLYANYFMLFRLFNAFKGAMTLASDLVEVQNIVDVTFGDMSDKMNEFAKSAIDALGMSELTAKQIGSKFQAMGTNMGITDEMIDKTNEFVQTATNGYADVAKSAADMSINLTRLAGDMASFYNQDYAEVAEKLQAIYTGQTRPLRAYGLDLTNATLQEWAHNHGLEVKIKTLTQAEKTLLRYQYVMAHTTAAQGDFQRTIGTFSNQVRIAKERINELKKVLGQIGIYTFKPLVVGFNNAMKTIIKGATGLLNSLGKIFGWQIEWEDGGVLQDEEDAAGDLADDMGDAADNAKKFKNFLLGIDELNLLPDNSDKDKGNGGLGGLGGALGDAMGGLNIKKTQGEFDSLYDTLYKLGRRISELLKNFLKGIDWDAVYKKARRFGKGLAQFFNGLLADAETFYEIGKALAGGLNAFANVVDAFHKEFDGWQLGVDIGKLVNGFTENIDWAVIKSAAVGAAHDLAMTINGAFTTINWDMVGSTVANGLNTVIDYFYTLGDEIQWELVGRSIAKGINGLFDNFDFAKAAQTLSTWIKGILDTLINLLDKTDWKKIGDSVMTFIKNVDFAGIAARFARLLWEAINAAVSAFTGLFNGEPILTAIATTIGLALSNGGIRKTITTGLGNLTSFAGKSLFKDLGNLFNGTLFKKFKSGYISSMTESIATSKLVGSHLRGVKDGFNEMSKSMSTATKVIGTTVVGLTELFAVKDSVYDLVKGTDDIGKSIADIAIAAGGAGVALTALLGFPAGLIATLAVGAVGAIIGIVEAMNELQEETVMGALTKELDGVGVKFEELTSEFDSISDNIGSTFDKMNEKADKITSTKKDLADVAKNFELIGSAAQTGHTIAYSAIEELGKDIEGLRQLWKQYIDESYDYLIQQAYADWAYLKTQDDYNDTVEQQMLDRIQRLEEMKNSDIQTMTEATAGYQAATDNLASVVEEFGIDSDEYITALSEWKEAAIEMSNGFASTGVSVESVSEKMSAAMQSFRDSKGIVDFSSLGGKDADYEEFVQNFIAQTQEMQNQFAGVTAAMNEDMAQFKQNTIEKYGGLTSEAEKDIAQHEKVLEGQLNTYKEEYYGILDTLQQGLYEKMYQVMANSGKNGVLPADAALAYAENVINPISDSLKTQYEAAGGELEPWLKATTAKFMQGAFEFDTEGIPHVYLQNWQQAWWDAGEDIGKFAWDAGTKTSKEFSDGVVDLKEQTSDAATVIADNFEGLAVVSAAFTKANKDFKKSVSDGSSDVTNRYRSMSNAASDAAKGVSEMSAAADKYDAVRAKVKVAADEFNTSSEKVKKLKGHVDELDGSMTVLDTDFSTMLTDLSTINSTLMENLPTTTEAFTTFFSGIKTDGQTVLTWFKEKFEPEFSSESWSKKLQGVGIAFNSAFKTAIEAVKGVWNQFAAWAKTNMKITIPKTKLPDGKETEPVDISIDVGSFYNGGFPEDGFFFANHSEMVGKFSNGRTAVANNEQIVEGIKQGVYDAVTAAWSSQGGGNVTVEITGDASDIFSAVVKENDRFIMRTGASPIRV